MKNNKNNLGFGIIGLLIIILVILAVGLVGFLVYKDKLKTISDLNPAFKTFCSTTGGLCLKYPSNWTFKQSISESVVPESDVFTSPSGNVVVDYLPGNGIGPTGNPSNVNIVSVNNTKGSGMEVVGAIIKGEGSSTYVAQLFVTNNSSGYDSSSGGFDNPHGYTAGQILNNDYWSVVPEFANPKLLSPGMVTQLDVEQANNANQQTGFSSEAAANAWLNSPEVKTGQLILQSANYK